MDVCDKEVEEDEEDVFDEEEEEVGEPMEEEASLTSVSMLCISRCHFLMFSDTAM